MKKSWLILAAGILLLGGCIGEVEKIKVVSQEEADKVNKQIDPIFTRYNVKIKTVEFDGCEYLQYLAGDRGGIHLTHKGNCKYCIQRNNSNK